MRPRLSLKVKFTLALGGLLALTTVSLGWILLLQVEKSALRDLRDKADILAKGLADGSELGVLTHNAGLLDPVLVPLREQSDVVYAGDRLVEILAGGATFDVPSPATGRLAEKLALPDDPVCKGQILGTVEEEQ